MIALFALGWFALMGGLDVLNPFDLSWMLTRDWHGHLYGWLFARNAPWQLPLGMAPDLLYPYGSSARQRPGSHGRVFECLGGFTRRVTRSYSNRGRRRR